MTKTLFTFFIPACLFLLEYQALSQPSMNPDFRRSVEGHFWPPAQLPHNHRPLNYERVVRSSISVAGEELAQLQLFCSATVVSNEGHILSARHCFDSCLRDLGAISNQSNYGKVRVINIDLQKAIGGICTFQINKDAKVEAEIVAVSPGRIIKSASGDLDPETPNESTQYWRDVKNHVPPNYEFSSDFIILKPTTQQKLPCSPAEFSKPRLKGNFIWAVGMPKKTKRTNRLNSDGQNQFVSTGPYCGVERQDEDFLLLKARYGLNASPLRDMLKYVGLGELIETLHNSLEPSTGTFYHSATVISGNSGGGLFDEDGKLVGITVATLPSPYGRSLEKYFLTCSSRGLSIERIYNLIEAQRGSEIAKATFNCSRRP